MIIKRSISFYLQKVYNSTNNGECQIRMRIRWQGNVAQFNCGYTINPKKWDSASSRCKKNVFNARGFSSVDINKELLRLEALAQDVFKMFEISEVIPSPKEFKDTFNLQNGKKVGVKNEKSVDEYIREFITEQSTIHSWSDGTKYKFFTLNKHLHEFKPDIKISDFNSDLYVKYIEYLLNVVKMKNTTAIKGWKFLQWFLRWADKCGYLSNKDYIDFVPRLKTVSDKEVVYLTWDELMQVYTLQFPEGKKVS